MTEYYLYLYKRKKPEEDCWRDECGVPMDCHSCSYNSFDEGCVIESVAPCPYEKDCQNPNCPNSIVEALCAVSLGNMESDELEDLLSLEPHVLREEQTQPAAKIGLEYVVKSVNANNRREAIAIKKAETSFETIEEFVENEGGEHHSLGGRTWDEWQRIINPMLSCIQSAKDILEYRNRNMPVIRTASGQCLMDFRDDVETPWLQSAATGKVNRPTSLAEIKAEEAEITWADEPADVRIVNTEPTPDALLIVDAIRRLPGYREPQPVEPLEESKGRWVSLEETVNIRNVSEKTLADYRTKGTKATDGLSGVDSRGYHWRRSRTNAPTEYFILNGASDRG